MCEFVDFVGYSIVLIWNK